MSQQGWKFWPHLQHSADFNLRIHPPRPLPPLRPPFPLCLLFPLHLLFPFPLLPPIQPCFMFHPHPITHFPFPPLPSLPFPPLANSLPFSFPLFPCSRTLRSLPLPPSHGPDCCSQHTHVVRRLLSNLPQQKSLGGMRKGHEKGNRRSGRCAM
ncbi:unnamed protein product [Closterium sp. NIES-54]